MCGSLPGRILRYGTGQTGRRTGGRRALPAPAVQSGYGDFDIAFQKPLMQMLDCAKNIGLTMTDSYMMTPTKSVTALIGAGR